MGIQESKLDPLIYGAKRAWFEEKPFLVCADSCKRGVGAILTQKDDDGAENPIAFGSRGISAHERKAFGNTLRRIGGYILS